MIDEKVLGRVAETGFAMAKSKRDATELLESFRPKQIECKSWLVQEIANVNMNWKKVLVLGSWNSLLLYELMSTHCDVEHFDFLDNDPYCHRDRDLYFNINNLFKNYSSITMDATKFSDHQSYDLVINTSCEHMKDIPAVYGPTYALQSNNYRAIKDQHINCVNSENQLAKQNNLTQTLYKGSLKLDNYTRFMAIGYHF